MKENFSISFDWEVKTAEDTLVSPQLLNSKHMS